MNKVTINSTTKRDLRVGDLIRYPNYDHVYMIISTPAHDVADLLILASGAIVREGGLHGVVRVSSVTVTSQD